MNRQQHHFFFFFFIKMGTHCAAHEQTQVLSWRRVWSQLTVCYQTDFSLPLQCEEKKTKQNRTFRILSIFFSLLPPSVLVVSIMFHIGILALPGPPPLFFVVVLLLLLSLLCNAALRSTALLPNWPMVGRDKGMNKVDVAKWSFGDFKWLWKPLGERRDIHTQRCRIEEIKLRERYGENHSL